MVVVTWFPPMWDAAVGPYSGILCARNSSSMSHMAPRGVLIFNTLDVVTGARHRVTSYTRIPTPGPCSHPSDKLYGLVISLMSGFVLFCFK